LLKVFVAYDSKYGNTKLAAENILEGIKESGEIETAIGYVKEVDAADVAGFDVIVFGAPNHMGRPSRAMKKFVYALSGQNLKAKQVAVFGTYSGRLRPVDRAVRKLENIVHEKLPNLKLITPSLSIRVKGVSGPVVEGELPKCVNFGKNIAAQIRSQ
jgi:flavorubredoxin